MVPKRYSCPSKNLKADFIWLGYSFHLSDDGFLNLTPSRMNQRFETSRRIINDVFQYVHSPAVRRRIYQVYISPVVDWFLPVIMTMPIHDLAKANKCATFQHDVLAKVLRVSRNCAADKLHENLAVKTVWYKSREMASRLSKFISRDHDAIYLGDQTSGPEAGNMRLRSGKTKSVIPWAGADKRDLGDRIYILAHEFNEIDDSIKDKYNKSSPNRQIFDLKAALVWARKTNASIQKRALQ